MKSTPLVLGTVQFGLAYGATNTLGKVPFEEVVSILELASDHSPILDSASGYGDSESVIGKAATETGKLKSFSAITKVVVNSSSNIKKQIYGQLEKTLKDLSGIKLYGVMLHHGNQVETFGDELVRVLNEAQKEYSIPKIGASVYNVEELELVSKNMSLEITQIPFNVFNQAFKCSPIISKLTNLGCEIHARSIFLQGTLLAEKSKLNTYFNQFEDEFSAYQKAVEFTGLTPLEFNLASAINESWIDKLVLGVTSKNEYSSIIEAIKSISDKKPPTITALTSQEEKLTNPAFWRLQ